MERFQQLEDFERHLWNMLFQATVKRNDPMRTPVMGTVSPNGPRLRTVVLRQADTQQKKLLFFTDIRSSKIQEIGQTPAISTLYWHPQKKVQIRCRGQASWSHQDKQCREIWEKLNAAGRRSYATGEAPGTSVAASTDGVPDAWNEMTGEAQTRLAFAHFAIIHQDVEEMEGLHLEQNGHQRALFQRKSDDRWSATWLIP